jgi:hypothetical protein
MFHKIATLSVAIDFFFDISRIFQHFPFPLAKCNLPQNATEEFRVPNLSNHKIITFFPLLGRSVSAVCRCRCPLNEL